MSKVLTLVTVGDETFTSVDPWEALETAARAIPIDYGSITLVYQDGRLLDIVKETRVRVGAQRLTE